MSFDLVFGGFLLIAIAWVIQMYSLIKYGNDIRPSFAALYGAGVLMLVLNDLEQGMTANSFLNIISLGTAAFMFVVLMKSPFDKGKK